MRGVAEAQVTLPGRPEALPAEAASSSSRSNSRLFHCCLFVLFCSFIFVMAAAICRLVWLAVLVLAVVSAAVVAAPAVPDEWLVRAAAGQLVWSAEPVAPLPNIGNGYMAAQFRGQYLYVAGVMTGDLPPPFGKAATGPVVCMHSTKK